ncbi:hypothetical protein TcBrA4_0138510 [Trypanosoma cruzi]|nr:hypothetical protein TcBrA4_0138510 [Trypanosoma cruzi]
MATTLGDQGVDSNKTTFYLLLLITLNLIEGNGSVFLYTATGSSDIGARMLDLARQHGDVRVQLAFVDEHGSLDAVVAAAATMTGLRLASGDTAMHWEESTVAGHFANRRAPQVPNFEVRVLLSIVYVCCPGVGGPAGAGHCWRAETEHRLRQCRRGRCGSECSALLSGGRGA